MPTETHSSRWFNESVLSLRGLSEKYTQLTKPEIDWLELLVIDWSLLADLALADAVLWVPTGEGEYLAVRHSRPTGLFTMFYRDVVGDFMRRDWAEIADAVIGDNTVVVAKELTWYEEAPMQLRAYPVSRRDPQTGKRIGPFAVVTLHAAPGDTLAASRAGQAYRESAADLLAMIGEGLFPHQGSQKGRLRGAPRVGDGIMRIDPNGVVEFASPNTLTSFSRLGFRTELEDEVLTDVVADIVAGTMDTNESIPLVAGGKIASRVDLEARNSTITMRSIPVVVRGERCGAIILTRDITDIKQQAQELITKDATIREIHHRVKNNLQTVASLLRVQSRRAESDEAKQVLGQAMRRVAAIAVVHDTLASGVAQIVNFDQVFERVLGLAVEVASMHNTKVALETEGKFGEIPSEYATPLALALTEVVTNAVEHGLADRPGTVRIETSRYENNMRVRVSDDGIGLPDNGVGNGLGTSIVRTLIEGELAGSILWRNQENSGAEVLIEIPLRWLTDTKVSE